jgi:DNA repair exonuclease SbcCD nuclease subunit
MKKYDAILTSDFHLSLNPPLARRGELHWFDAMRKPLDEIISLSDEYTCPILNAGDLFDVWNSSAELLSFALGYLPRNMFAIPGQHDLSFHDFKALKRSAFYTLMMAKQITLMGERKHVVVTQSGVDNIAINGFPFGADIVPASEKIVFTRIAMSHQYVWHKQAAFDGAPLANNLKHVAKQFKGYDVVLFGDNHKTWIERVGDTIFFNPGSLMRRTSDQIDHRPCVGLLHDKDIDIHYLDISGESFDVTMKQDLKVETDLNPFLQQIKQLESADLDFVEAMNISMKKFKVSQDVRRELLKAMESK